MISYCSISDTHRIDALLPDKFITLRNKTLKLVFAFTFIISFHIEAQQLNQASFQMANMAYDQQSPVVSPDGRLLIFTVSNHPQNAGGVRDAGDIWYSVLNGSTWSAPVHASAAINNLGYNVAVGFSPDGEQLFLLGHYDPQGNEARTQGLSVSKKSGTEWLKPENISIPYFQNRSNLQGGYLSFDGSVFVYSAETYGSYGVEDLYVTIKSDAGNWSEPKNLGSKINTTFQELSPSLSLDGKTLYFSTTGRRGAGSFDVFSTTRLDDTWMNWSTPENVVQINSDGRELYYRQYPAYAIYTSTKNSDRYADIKIFVPENPFVDTLKVITKPIVVAPVERIPEPTKVNNNLKIRGKVINTKTAEVVLAKLVFETADTIVSANSSSQGYTAEVKPGKSYVIKLEAPGYISNVQKLDAAAVETKNLEMNFSLQPIEVGTTVTLKSVLFMQSKPELLPESYPELNEVVQFMLANPNVEIELSGHTDNRGSYRQLLSLSQQRVNRVKNYLVSKGINAKRIVGRGYGGEKPIASNDTEESRALNRRVEFTIKKL